MSNEGKILIGIGIVTLIIVVGAAMLFGGKATPEAPTPKLSQDQMKLLIRPNSHTMKVDGSKLTLVEFGDFQCPACGAYYPIVTKLLADYKGKLTFVFRNFPLSMHQNAKLAAEAAEAAGAQGKFFAMYDNLYQNQKDWGESNKPMDYMQKYAQNLGLDMNKFNTDVKNNKYDSIIQNDVNDGTALGVNSTPSFFLNGEKLKPGITPDEFKVKFDADLNGAK